MPHNPRPVKTTTIIISIIIVISITIIVSYVEAG